MALMHLESSDAALAWLVQRGARALQPDSRRIEAGDAFIAWPGAAVDGRQFVPQALAAGACGCLVEADGADAFAWAADAELSARVATMSGLKNRSGAIASAFMGAPSERLNVMAVTGTNGKTSTAWWLAQGLSFLGQRCGVIGTLGVGEPPSAAQASAIEFTGMTTPDPITVQAAFKRFVDHGFKACAIEASSIGIPMNTLMTAPNKPANAATREASVCVTRSGERWIYNRTATAPPSNAHMQKNKFPNFTIGKVDKMPTINPPMRAG